MDYAFGSPPELGDLLASQQDSTRSLSPLQQQRQEQYQQLRRSQQRGCTQQDATPFPLVSWPQRRGAKGNLDTIDIGKTNNMLFLGREGSFLSKNKIVRHLPQKCPLWMDQNVRLKSNVRLWAPLGPLCQLQPPTKPHRMRPHGWKPSSADVRRHISRLNAYYPDLGIDIDVVKQYLDESIDLEFTTNQFDMSIGNQLATFRPWRWNSSEFGYKSLKSPVYGALQRRLNLIDLDAPFDLDEDSEQGNSSDECTEEEEGVTARSRDRKRRASTRYAQRTWVAMPLGTDGRDLRVYPCPAPDDTVESRLRRADTKARDVKEMRPDDRVISSFMTPITEIKSIPSDPRLLAVRTRGGISMLATFESFAPSGAPRIEAVTLPTQYSFGEANPWVINMSPNRWNVADMVLSSSDGSIHLWNYNEMFVQTLRGPKDGGGHEWGICEYWNSPMTLMAADGRSLAMLDSRAGPQCCATTLFSLEGERSTDNVAATAYGHEYITAACPSEGHIMHALVATNKTLRIYDQRYAKRPVMSWTHAFLPYDPPRFIASVHTDYGTASTLDPSLPGAATSVVLASKVLAKSAIYTYSQYGHTVPYVSLDQSGLTPFTYHPRCEALHCEYLASETDWSTPWDHIRPADFHITPGLAGLAICRGEDSDRYRCDGDRGGLPAGRPYYVFQLSSDLALYGQVYAPLNKSKLEDPASLLSAVNDDGEQRIMFKDWHRTFTKPYGVIDGTDTKMYSHSGIVNHNAKQMKERHTQLRDYKQLDLYALYKYIVMAPHLNERTRVGGGTTSRRTRRAAVGQTEEEEARELCHRFLESIGYGDLPGPNTTLYEHITGMKQKVMNNIQANRGQSLIPLFARPFIMDEGVARSMANILNMASDRARFETILDLSAVVDSGSGSGNNNRALEGSPELIESTPVNTITTIASPPPSSSSWSMAARRPTFEAFSRLVGELRQLTEGERSQANPPRAKLLDDTIKHISTDLWLASAKYRSLASQTREATAKAGSNTSTIEENGAEEEEGLSDMGNSNRRHVRVAAAATPRQHTVPLRFLQPKNDVKFSKAAIALSRIWDKLPSNAFDKEDPVSEYTTAGSESLDGYSSSGYSSHYSATSVATTATTWSRYQISEPSTPTNTATQRSTAHSSVQSTPIAGHLQQ
ncbi:hypothetical protein EV182_000178 [Spiromyces aspiralis]|uniref:Uncharacterized protein n=1 Tax=Spiromyces aspiralis TaxID=68401 RepID=A0ACC1HX37_9FUNG|nr:hypothetical protein EV182_000178 [Spiromyces aspiralis]